MLSGKQLKMQRYGKKITAMTDIPMSSLTAKQLKRKIPPFQTGLN
jgi:hypothetical protein